MKLVRVRVLKPRVPGVLRALAFAMEFQSAAMDPMNQTAQVSVDRQWNVRILRFTLVHVHECSLRGLACLTVRCVAIMLTLIAASEKQHKDKLGFYSCISLRCILASCGNIREMWIFLCFASSVQCNTRALHHNCCKLALRITFLSRSINTLYVHAPGSQAVPLYKGRIVFIWHCLSIVSAKYNNDY